MIAVAALDVESDALDLCALLDPDARRYQPHVTILPRFECRSLPELKWPGMVGFRLPLRGPKNNGAGLWWYESDPALPGFDCLMRLHADLASQLGDEKKAIASDFWHDGYLPHLTLGRALPSRLHLPEALEVRVTSACTYEILQCDPPAVTRHSAPSGIFAASAICDGY